MQLRQFNQENECDIQDGISPASIEYVGLVDEIPEIIINKLGGYAKLLELLSSPDSYCVIFNDTP